jgi:myo-inositol-1(or 4)-monophosphatase
VTKALPDLEKTMLDWGTEAAAVALQHFHKTGELEFKYAREAVTAADREIEKLISRRIQTKFPDDAIFGEEFGQTQAGDDPGSTGNSADSKAPADLDSLSAGRIWHLDPIDGTLNFALGLPNFCTSIALMDGDEILAACVYSPLHAEGFTASLGNGTRLNGEDLHVSSRSSLSEAIISAQLQKGGRYVQNSALLKAILLTTMKMRRLGTIALEMAYLAAGRYDAMIAGRGRPQQLYDVAAGILLVREAAGQVTDHLGEVYRPYTTDLVASNSLVHDELIALIADHETSTDP